jgi:hypothetical protein
VIEVLPVSKKNIPVASRAEPSAGFGAPVLLEGEDGALYNKLLTQVTAAVAPTDVIEEFWVRDVVELLWEAMRLRRLKASLLRSSAMQGLDQVLAPILRYAERDELVKAWYAREEDALNEVQELLDSAGLTMDSVMSQTLSKKMDDVERIDRMLASAEARRHIVLREVDRHRAAVAARLQTAAKDIEDAEFSEVSAEGLPSKAA